MRTGFCRQFTCSKLTEKQRTTKALQCRHGPVHAAKGRAALHQCGEAEDSTSGASGQALEIPHGQGYRVTEGRTLHTVLASCAGYGTGMLKMRARSSYRESSPASWQSAQCPPAQGAGRKAPCSEPQPALQPAQRSAPSPRPLARRTACSGSARPRCPRPSPAPSPAKPHLASSLLPIPVV